MDKYKEFTAKMKSNYLEKYVAMDVFNILVNGDCFIDYLIKIKDKKSERDTILGVIFSEDYEKDDEEYFGENKVLFYAGEDDYDILDYDELYMYLNFTCEFYLEKNPEEKEKVDKIFKEIEKIYNM